MRPRYSQLSLSERHQIARWRDAKVPLLDIALFDPW
jgi:IS30 family transposase